MSTQKNPTTTAPSIGPLLPTPTKPLPFHKLSPEAIAQRRKDGLCFRCPAKYSPGHVCSPPQFLFIVDPGDSDPSDSLLQADGPAIQPPEFMSLSPAAFYGMSSPQTLRLTGFVRGKPVTVLIDCGSTHNIMQPRIAANLSIPSQPIAAFPVMVGNGAYIDCEGYCSPVPVHLNHVPFDLSFFLFPIHGADIVLGISWLASLGPICADFSIPQISFTLHGVTTTLKGDVPFKPVSAGSLATLLKSDCVASLHTLIPSPDPSPALPPPPPSTDPHILTLLDSFSNLFSTPQSLPQSRPHDHAIPLLPNTPPVNVKPYRYPHFQKQIMTQLIAEMLRDGIIRPSQSPFSSPVLLVKKKTVLGAFALIIAL